MGGVNSITWSRGLRARYALEDEREDQAIVDEEVGTVEDTVLSVSAASWLKLSRIKGGRAKLLRLVNDEDDEGAMAYLASVGCIAVLGKWPDEGESHGDL